MIVLLVTFISVFIGLIGWWYYEFFKHNTYLSKYKGPTPLPIVGNIYKIGSNKDIIPVIMDYLKKHGPVIGMWFGFRPRIIIADYRVAEILLDSTTIITKSYDYKFFEPWLGTGLLTSTGNKWRTQRKLLTPTFHFQILEQYISTFNIHNEILIKKIRDAIDEKPLDIYPIIKLWSLDMTCESVMGVQLNAQSHDSEYAHNVSEITKTLFHRMFSVLITYDFLYSFTSECKREQKILEILHNHTSFIIRSREKELLESELKADSATAATAEDEFGRKRRMAFLDLLLECRKGGANLTTENIREQVDTFMFEGHDTTTAGVSFTLYCLAHHMGIQKKVVEEVLTVLDNDINRSPTYQDLQDMKYLDMVVKESMRLYPPAPFWAREVTQDTEFDGVTLPRGTNLTMFLYGLHRQEEMFPDPEKFDPERFTLENCAKRSPFAYLPFSAGVRNCIGQRFAMIAMKSVICRILLNYEITAVPGFKPLLVLESMLRSHNGILLNVKRRVF